MQPMLIIQSRARSSFTSGASIVRFVRGESRVVTTSGTRGIPSGMCLGASFWKKNLP
jgi:hypothetical protein